MGTEGPSVRLQEVGRASPCHIMVCDLFTEPLGLAPGRGGVRVTEFP